ncbi:tyrosine-type recombinase/integrase (plasmid) [Hymenobacter tibetensis]|uniref:Tyrosine-type recombinase/integrase n=1 Tax=Hymenobacter tibetensis TaxID=497967 RepID=A0ABY4D8P5_9BACT|nr:tyrosine-type recombinase/integrase [Hymenobacter tibetensis]UOG77591.1 tyrosine-type recombinase/integrase [Hymenobacter tibetensis]
MKSEVQPEQQNVPAVAAQQVGATRSINDYAESAARYVTTGQRGAANTQRAYAGDWQRFTLWCQEHGRHSLPADVPTLAAFVTALADAGKKVATIQRHCASISKAHQLARLPTPTDDRQFKELMEGISREKGVRQKQAPAFTLAYFKRALHSIDAARPDGLRDRALLLLGLAGAFRRDELASIDIGHLHFDEDGLVVDLLHSKTNQKGEAEEKAIFFSPDRRSCPVRAVKDWLHLLEQHGRTEGPLFLSFHKGQRLSRRRLSTFSLNEIVQLRLGAQYTAHSLRASFVTIAKLNGADDSEVMNQTKHKTTDMIRRYTRLDNIRQHNAAQKLGL